LESVGVLKEEDTSSQERPFQWVDLNLDPFEKLVDRHVKMVIALFTGEHVDTIFLLILLSPCHDKKGTEKG
jgi:hypothetical protein